MPYSPTALTLAQTLTFAAEADKLWSEEERLEFFTWLATNPEAAAVIPGSGGCRKVRRSRAGTGKRGGVRAIYFARQPTRKCSSPLPSICPLWQPEHRSPTQPVAKRQIKELRHGVGHDPARRCPGRGRYERATRDGGPRRALSGGSVFRLSTFPVLIPPLRERRDDIPLLVSKFLNRYAHTHSRRVPGFTTAALRALMQHSYPGNVRELEQLIERAAIPTPDDQPIDLGRLFFRPLGGPGGVLTVRADGRMGLPDDNLRAPSALDVLLDQQWSLAKVSATLVELALRRTHGNVAQASRMLGVTRARIDYRLRRQRSGVQQD